MEDTGCTLDELPTAMNERDEWKQCIKNCRAYAQVSRRSVNNRR